MLSLLISSCDKFSDLWDANHLFLKENWENCTAETFLVTDRETSKEYDGWRIIVAGDDLEMPARLMKALDYINTPYVLLTLDDYFLIKKVQNKQIEDIILLMDSYNIDYCRLYPINKEKKRALKGNKWLYKIDLRKEYAVNLYPGIWKTDFLRKTFNLKTDVWKYEVSLTSTAIKSNAICVMSRRNEFYILDVVRKGKVLHRANRFLKKKGVSLGNRPLVSWKTEFRYFVFGTFSHILPSGLKRIVKKIMRKIGFKFYSD